MIVHRKQLKSIWIAGGEIRRRLVTIGRNPIVLLSKTHPILQPCFTSERWRSFAAHSKLPVELANEVDHWNRGLRFSFNCHAMSIGGLLGMGTDEWLEGSSSIFTLQENPTQTLLDAHFPKVTSVFNTDDLPDMLHNDVLVLRDKSSGDLVHSGRIRLLADESHMLLSKLGEHPAAVASIDAVVAEYQGQFDCLDLYRSDEFLPETVCSHSRQQLCV